MTQSELNREVASATGESVSLIDERGFSLVPEPSFECYGSEPPAIGQHVDWDEMGLGPYAV